MENERVSYTLTPKGLLTKANGGFVNYEQTNRLYLEVAEYLIENGMSIAVVDNELVFMKIAKRKSLFSRIFNR